MSAPSESLPEWASAATYPAGVNPWSGQPPTVSTGMSALAAQGHIPDTQTDAETYNYWLRLLSLWVGYLADERGASVFGDGSDGDDTITGGTTVLTRDVYYQNLTIEASGVLDANGFRVFVAGTLTIESGGYIHNNGADGASGAAGGAGGAAASSGSVLGGSSGGAGGNVSNGTVGTGLANAIGGNGGAGGVGDGGTYTGGGGGAAAAPAASDGGYRHLDAALGRLSGIVFAQFTGGAGGGGGAGGDSGTGGGGGGGGGVLCVWAHTAALEGAGALRANGGNGGDAFSGPDAAGNGGGAGGGGGAVYLVTRNRSGAGTIVAAGGTGGALFGNGTVGADGSAGFTAELDA